MEEKVADLQESLAHTRRELSKARELQQSTEEKRLQTKERLEHLERVSGTVIVRWEQ